MLKLLEYQILKKIILKHAYKIEDKVGDHVANWLSYKQYCNWKTKQAGNLSIFNQHVQKVTFSLNLINI